MGSGNFPEPHRSSVDGAQSQLVTVAGSVTEAFYEWFLDRQKKKKSHLFVFRGDPVDDATTPRLPRLGLIIVPSSHAVGHRVLCRLLSCINSGHKLLKGFILLLSSKSCLRVRSGTS